MYEELPKGLSNLLEKEKNKLVNRKECEVCKKAFLAYKSVLHQYYLFATADDNIQEDFVYLLEKAKYKSLNADEYEVYKKAVLTCKNYVVSKL